MRDLSSGTGTRATDATNTEHFPTTDVENLLLFTQIFLYFFPLLAVNPLSFPKHLYGNKLLLAL